MKIIYKYYLEEGMNKITMPAGSKVIKAGYQESRDRMAIWVVAQVGMVHATRKIFVARTGVPLPVIGMIHIDTILLDKGSFVLHVFDCGEDP